MLSRGSWVLVATAACAMAYQCVPTRVQGEPPMRFPEPTAGTTATPPVPQAPAGTTVQIVWLEAALMLQEFLGRLNMKHVGLAFVVKEQPSLNWTVEYYARWGFLNTIAPHAQILPTGECELIPCNDGQIDALEGIQERWDSSRHPSSNATVLGTIPAESFNRFSSEWLADQIASPHLYDLLEVSLYKMKYLKFYTCQTFAIDALNALHKYGASFVCDNGMPSLSSQTLVSSKPAVVNPTNDQEVCKFFALLPDFPEIAHTPVKSLLSELDATIKAPNKFIFNDGRYYQITPKFPYIGLELHNKLPIPGCSLL